MERRHQLDTMLGRVHRTSVAKDGQIAADPLELSSGHLDGGGILSIGNAQYVRLNLEQLEIELRDLVLLCES
jgi:hypothetical protein